jgi:hypothetical protein
MPYIEIEIHGEERIMAALREREAREGRRAREFVNDLSTFVTHDLVSTVPTYDEYLLRHVGRSDASWRPGGLGGGGEWESVAGIKTGTSRHPLYVEFGTGIYAGRGRIYPLRARVLRFEKPGPELDGRRVSRVKFRRWVRGQRGQHYFYEAWRDLNLYAQTRLLRRDF